MEVEELVALLYQAGFRGQDLITMTAIALAENPQRDPTLQSFFVHNGRRERSFGLFQLNLDAHPDLTYECAISPQCSSDYAYRLYKQEGFRPWSAYLTGAFWAFWDRAQEAVRTVLSLSEEDILEIADRAGGVRSGPVPEPEPGLIERITNPIAQVFRPVLRLLEQYLSPSFLSAVLWRTLFTTVGILLILIGVIIYGIGTISQRESRYPG